MNTCLWAVLPGWSQCLVNLERILECYLQTVECSSRLIKRLWMLLLVWSKQILVCCDSSVLEHDSRVLSILAHSITLRLVQHWSWSVLECPPGCPGVLKHYFHVSLSKLGSVSPTFFKRLGPLLLVTLLQVEWQVVQVDCFTISLFLFTAYVGRGVSKRNPNQRSSAMLVCSEPLYII